MTKIVSQRTMPRKWPTSKAFMFKPRNQNLENLLLCGLMKEVMHIFSLFHEPNSSSISQWTVAALGIGVLVSRIAGSRNPRVHKNFHGFTIANSPCDSLL
jgi:hypothetical protein